MGKLYRRKGSPYWQAEWRDRDGRRLQQSTGQVDRSAARQWLVEREREATSSVDCPRNNRTVEDALSELLSVAEWRPRTRAANLSRVGHLNGHLGKLRVGKLTSADVERYIDQRRIEKVSDHSISKELCILRQTLRLARVRGWIAVEPPLPKHRPRYRPRERWLTQHEYARLRAALPERRRTWLDVACWLGLRRSEVDALDWADVDLVAGLIRVRGTKTAGADRTIGIPAGLLAVLPERGAGPVAGRWGNVLRDIDEACTRAGVATCSPNDLRRTCATWLATAGVPALDIARWLGHRSLDMVMRVYARVAPDSMRQAANLLGGVSPGRSTEGVR